MRRHGPARKPFSPWTRPAICNRKSEMSIHGIYVQRLSNGTIHGVQVEDDAGNYWSISPEEYEARGYLPTINSLPDAEDYKPKP